MNKKVGVAVCYDDFRIFVYFHLTLFCVFTILTSFFGNGNLLILKEETLKVFRFYFLALLLICALPVFAQEAPAPEAAKTEEATPPGEAAPQNEAVTDGQTEATEAPAEETAPAEDAAQPKEETPAEEAAPAKEETPAEAQAEDGQSDLEAELAAQAGESDSDELATAEKEKQDQPTLTVGVNNGFSHGFAKERKSFGYSLNIYAAYMLPWELVLAADVGLRESYRYGMTVAYAAEDGSESTESLSASKFDGTPLNIGLSKGFPLFAGINGSLGIGVSLPFTSKEMWDVYDIRTILAVELGLSRNFPLSKDVMLGLSFGFSYAKTFAEYDAAWDEYSNEPLGYIQNHDISLSLGLGIGYKGFAFKVSGGYSFGSDFKLDSGEYYYDDWGKSGTIDDSEWYYLFSFGATASYTIKGFVFALGVRTNAPEFDNGNYEGFTKLAGEPEVKNGSTNYPFKAKYTTVFANIGYSYSF